MTSLEALQVLLDADHIDNEGAKPILRKILEDDSDDTEQRKAALCLHLEAAPDEIDEGSGENEFDAPGRATYLVLTDDEADEAAKEAVKESAWAFNAAFLAGETGLDEDVFQALQGNCEGANEAVLSLIKATCGFDSFADSAIGADGRGHFLAGYDHDENEEGEFYIYRTN